jgi:streptogramin lyase
VQKQSKGFVCLLFAATLMAGVMLGLPGPASAASGNITEYSIPTGGSEPLGITAGPNGNLWFTEYEGNNIGKITPSGAITEYSIPTGGGNPTGITAGPDGNLWFTEHYGNKIGKITTGGAITEYSIPTGGGNPSGITAGPDGNLWFTEQDGNKIGKITTSGTITEYSIPTSYSWPWGIAAGPDGNLWFTEYYGNTIGKITTGGTITEYSIPTSNCNPSGITAGPDGKLWFTEQDGNIGKITTGGTITEYSIPTSYSNPYGIAAGPDGNLWFTEYEGNKIGKFCNLMLNPDSETVGYTGTPTIAATGNATHFASGSTALSITNSSNASVTGSAGSKLAVTDATDASFDLPNGLGAGTYTVTLTTGSEVMAANLIVNTPTPAPSLAITGTTAGTAGGSTKITASPNTGGDTLDVLVSATSISTPNTGSAPPSGAVAYTLGSDISAAAGDYVGVYELSSGDVVAFSQVGPLTGGEINTTSSSNTISSVSAGNGAVTVNLGSAPTGTPAISDFTVTQSINGGTATAITPTAIRTSGATVTLTVPQVSQTSAAQSVVDTVSYDSGAAVTGISFTVPAASSTGQTTAYTVTYSANTGTGAVADSTAYAPGDTVTALDGTGLIPPSGLKFAGWNTEASGGGAPYQAGNVFSITGSVTLYAQWVSQNPTLQAPDITHGSDNEPGSGSFSGAQTVTITDPNPGAGSVAEAVYYTVDNTVPTLTSSSFTGSSYHFSLSQSAEVCAAVYNQNLGWSPGASDTYTLVYPTSQAYTTIKTSSAAPPTTIEFQSNGSGNTVDLTSLLSSASRNATVFLPPLVLETNNSLGAGSAVAVSVYAGTTITALPSSGTWNHEFNAPTNEPDEVSAVQTGATASDLGFIPSVTSVIEIGDGETPLNLSQPARVLFPNAAGDLVGYYQGGSFYRISYQMTTDSAAGLVDSQGVSHLDGYYEDSNTGDLIVWTNHFTEYALFTENTATAAEVASSLEDTTIAPASGATSLTLPTATGFTITITSSSNPDVISTSGTITPSATATTVNLVLNITNQANSSDTSTASIAVTVPARSATSSNSGGGGCGSSQETLISISTGSLSPSTAGEPYSATITAEGTAPYTFSVVSGSLPGGLTLDESTGVLSGTPTAAGQYSFSISVKDADGNTASRAYTLTVNMATVPSTQAAPTLTDITGNWAAGDIEQLVSQGYLSGYPDGTFKPDSEITRAEFCAIMDKVLNLTTVTQETPQFNDVQTGDWYYQPVEEAVYAGIAKGYNEGYFKPNAPISRQEMACVLVQALGESQLADTNAKTKTKFADDASIAGWSRGYIFVANQQGIISGYPDGSFQPRSNATRAEACAMISKLLGLLGK